MSYFNDLVFEEAVHKYHVGAISLRSVSSVVELFHDVFDSDEQGKIYAEKYGFQPHQVTDAWTGKGEISAESGHRVHAFAEQYVKWKYFKAAPEPKLTCVQCLGVVQFWNDLPARFVPVALEYKMYRLEYNMAGTADVIILDLETGNLLIFDYKTNEELFSKWNNGYIKYIPTKIQQENFGFYTVQLNLYELMLLQTGYNVRARVIIHLKKQDNGKLYETYKCKHISEELRPYLT